MKKYVFAVLTIFLGFSAFAQVKIGLKLSPNLAWNSATFGGVDTASVAGNGVKLRGGMGVIVDLNLSDNFAFSTGASYSTKGAGFRFTNTLSVYDSAGAVISTSDTTFTSKMALQYLEIPISFKVYTNEIMDYTKLYFHVGVTENVRLSAKVNDEKVKANGESYNKDVNLLETSLLLGTGIEMEMGESTMFLAGISYNRGLFNIDNTNTFNSPNKLTNNYISLDLGLKF